MAKCKRSFLWNLSSWKETSGNEEHLCKLRLRPFSWLVHEPSRTQFVQCPTQLRNERGEDQRICSLALPGGISCLSLGKIQFQSYLWQSCGKAEKFYCVLSSLEALRGLGILVAFGSIPPFCSTCFAFYRVAQS